MKNILLSAFLIMGLNANFALAEEAIAPEFMNLFQFSTNEEPSVVAAIGAFAGSECRKSLPVAIRVMNEVWNGNEKERSNGRHLVDRLVRTRCCKQRPGDGDQDRHGLSDDEQHQRAGQSFLNEVTHGWLTVDAELHAEVAGDERRPPLYVTHGERVIEVVLGLRCLDELEVFRQSAGRSWPQNVEERIAQQIHGAKCQRTDG